MAGRKPDGEDDGLVGAVHSHIVAGAQDAAMPLAHDEAAGGDAGQGRDGLVVRLPRCAASCIEAQVVHLQ